MGGEGGRRIALQFVLGILALFALRVALSALGPTSFPFHPPLLSPPPDSSVPPPSPSPSTYLFSLFLGVFQLMLPFFLGFLCAALALPPLSFFLYKRFFESSPYLLLSFSLLSFSLPPSLPPFPFPPPLIRLLLLESIKGKVMSSLMVNLLHN